MIRVFFSLTLIALCVAQENAAVSSAIDSLQHGDPATAEQTLRAELKARPGNVPALDVLGVVLDQEKKFADAEEVYRRAIALDQTNPGLLNNYGNHLVASGKTGQARAVFLRVLALNPKQANAAVQLARMALAQKQPSEAARFLARVPQGAQQMPDVEIMTMQADYALGRVREADAVFERVSPHSDPRRLAAALASVGQYDKAEALFSRALEAAPSDFQTLYDLGLAASHAGHPERAREVLETALAQQPDNIDLLYDLAVVNAALHRDEAALELLGHASRLSPNRTDVLRLLALTSAQVGYFGDSIQAWDRYLKLAPADDIGRRERAFAQSALGNDLKAGLAGLHAYVTKHPRDPMGHYELGVALSATETQEAMHEFDAALRLRPDLVPAHVARGLLNYRGGHPTDALPDFEFAARRDPTNATVLDHLGQAYLTLDRSAEALPVLRKAAELAPGDSQTLMHLARALSETGHKEEAKTAFARFRELGPDQAHAHPAGLIDFLSLSPEEQLARYRAGVERTVRQYPSNAEAQVRYLELLLSEGKTDDAASTSAHIAALKPDIKLLVQAGDALIAAEQYRTAKDFLERVVSTAAPSADLSLDLAIATFRSGDAQAALGEMDRVPAADRTGDYYLARAEMLDASGHLPEAEAAIRAALHENPKRPELYRQGAAMLIRNGRADEAVALLDHGSHLVTNEPDLLLARAAAVAIAGGAAEAERQLRELETRWPEFADAWAADAILADVQGHPDAAQRMLDTALLLAPDDAAIRAQRDMIGRQKLRVSDLSGFVSR